VNRRVDRCKVSHESPASYLNKRGFIDILITREAAGERYAVILENKVNGAADTDAQLYKYVGYLKTERNFRDVFVIYLPLRARVMPSADSLGDIRMDPAVTFKELTFAEFILPWLKDECCREGIPEEMRDNLKHYRDFISFLIGKDKELKMQNEILKLLQEKDAKLPAFRDVLALREYVTDLIQCHQMVLRAKLLRSMQKTLESDGAELLFADDNDVYNCRMKRMGDSMPELYTRNFCAVGLPVNNLAIANVGVRLGTWDPLFMLIGDRSISGKRDDSFASFVRGKDFALIFNEGNAWYHYEMRQMGWDDWKTGSDQLAGELREHWKKMMEITATFPMRAVSELD